MASRIIPLLLFLSFISAQIALPTFQAMHKPQNTSGDCNGTPENPLGSSGLTPSHTNVTWNWMMGYTFTPQVDGCITKLGGYFSGTKTVRLWKYSDGTFLGSVSHTGNNSWTYTNLSSSVSVTAGTKYVVAVALNGSGGAYRQDNTHAIGNTYGSIVIECNVLHRNYDSDTMPNWQQPCRTDYWFCIPDITFEPDS